MSEEQKTEVRPSSDADAFEQFRKQQVQQMEDDLPDDSCMIQLPEGQFVRGH